MRAGTYLINSSYILFSEYKTVTHKYYNGGFQVGHQTDLYIQWPP